MVMPCSNLSFIFAAALSANPGPSRLSFRTAGRDLRAVQPVMGCSAGASIKGRRMKREQDVLILSSSALSFCCTPFRDNVFRPEGPFPSRAARPQTDGTRRPCKTPGSRRAFTSVVSLKALAQANSRLPNGLYHKCEFRERLRGRQIRLCAAPD